MKTEHEDGVQLGGAHFRSPPSYIRDPYNRIMGSLSPAGLLSPLTDPLVYEHTEYGTSGAPSFSSSEAMTPGRENGEQDAFLSSRDSVHSTSERIRNIALKKLYHLGYIKGMGKEAAGDMVIRCVKCDEICLGKRAALNHMFTFHPEVEPYECQLCASSFHAKNSLRFHYVVTHISERMVCDVCGKRFSHPHLFKSHRLFHELETHVCDVCDHQFCNYSSYKRHTRLHRKNLKQKRVCGFCLKKFTTDRTYWKHMERHNSSQMFHCSRCNETFMEKKVLAEHWLTHEDQLPYLLCTGCDWLYYTKKQRSKHCGAVQKLSDSSVKKLLQTFTQSKKLQWNVTITI